MVRPIAFGIGKLGLRLALAFLGVALASIIVLSYLTEISTGHDISSFIKKRELAQTKSIAVSAGAMFMQPPQGWRHANLMPLLFFIHQQGNGAQVRDGKGTAIITTPGFAKVHGDPTYTVPVNVEGHRVGSVTLKFPTTALGNSVEHFEQERLRASLSAAGVAALMALAVSLLISRQIAAPLERILAAIRARGAGDRSTRIQDAQGTGVVHELSVALNEASDAIDQRDRLQRNLVANIAHELRTPVAILQASHEAMLDGVTPPTTENLWSLRDEVLRLTRMIEDLQRLAAAEAAALQLQLEPQDLAAIATDAATSLSDSFGAAGVSLVRRLDEVWVMCDPERMREVVVNLLTNALKFTPADGQVVLETMPGEKGRGILTVTDTGVGIPAEDLPRVTERFFRGQRSAELATGSGIGLTIVAELVRAQDGNLLITSELGQGTRVTVTVPLAKTSVSPDKLKAELERGFEAERRRLSRGTRTPKQPQGSAASAGEPWA